MNCSYEVCKEMVSKVEKLVDKKERLEKSLYHLKLMEDPLNCLLIYDANSHERQRKDAMYRGLPEHMYYSRYNDVDDVVRNAIVPAIRANLKLRIRLIERQICEVKEESL